jgi:Z1 domain
VDQQIITPRARRQPLMLWQPVQGDEVSALIRHLSLDTPSSERLASEAVAILSKCSPPHAGQTSTTGLVLGYVQSGKTLSFTTVAALARDNSYPMVIVITGTSNPLLDQSMERIEQDLRLQNNRKWRLFQNPKMDDRQSISNVLADWTDDRIPDRRRQTVIITVLKNTTNLRNLNEVLEQLDLRRLGVLVIDDEADQAGLNTAVTKNRESTTYQRLVSLRRNLPQHAYLQYTATPQAPLLINIADALSPRFVELLTPGNDYIGGRVFFLERPDLVRVIPDDEIPRRDHLLHDVPPSLLAALRLFVIGVAAGFIRGHDQGTRRQNRSMLVHPSRETPGHSQYFHWIRSIIQNWLEVLGTDREGHERRQFIATFKTAYDDLAATVADLPDFEEISEELEYSLRHTELLEVNAVGRRTPQPEWRNAYPWILVGGQAMDRGFTVEGLTVTYMPRTIGVGNADTIEQRARFFGYKRAYLGYCRVFLERAVGEAFHQYVAHEEDIRKRLAAHRESGRPLDEWRRAFFLDTRLSPTRRQVLSVDFKQATYSDEWFWPRVPHGAPELLDRNRRLVSSFVSSASWADSPGDSRRTSEQLHLVAGDVLLADVYERLLAPFMFTEEHDSQSFTGLLLQVKAYLDDVEPYAPCSVFRMSRGVERVRSVNDAEQIPTLFQGANYADKEKTVVTYPGDSEIHGKDEITIQIHTLRVMEKKQQRLIASDVPALAVWVPSNIAKDWLVQETPGQH